MPCANLTCKLVDNVALPIGRKSLDYFDQRMPGLVEIDVEAIFGHVDADEDGGRFVHDPTLRMRAQAQAAVRVWDCEGGGRTKLCPGLASPRRTRAAPHLQPRRLRSGGQLRHTRRVLHDCELATWRRLDARDLSGDGSAIGLPEHHEKRYRAVRPHAGRNLYHAAVSASCVRLLLICVVSHSR